MQKIKNYKLLAKSKLRKDALGIAEAGLQAIDTKKNILKTNILNNLKAKRIFVIAVGKCAYEASQALEERLGDKIYKGISLDVCQGELIRIKCIQGTHPLPSEQNIKATKKIIKLLKETREDDLVLFIISGGGSTLLSEHNDEEDIMKELLKSGKNIYDINKIRKTLSSARAGGLTKYAYPSRVISLIFSDVPGNDISFISSGPTVQHDQDDKYFNKVDNILFISNKVALRAMLRKSQELGYDLDIISANLQGEARKIGPTIIDNPGLYGGETTVKVKGKGKGGRNQELCLSTLPYIKNQLILAIASDGIDNSEHAGAICDIITKESGVRSQEYLENNNSFNFFKKTKDAIITGKTGSNVSDLIIILHDQMV